MILQPPGLNKNDRGCIFDKMCRKRAIEKLQPLSVFQIFRNSLFSWHLYFWDMYSGPRTLPLRLSGWAHFLSIARNSNGVEFFLQRKERGAFPNRSATCYFSKSFQHVHKKSYRIYEHENIIGDTLHNLLIRIMTYKWTC